MEKIKTPLMQLKEDIKKWKPQLQKRQQDAVDKVLKHIDSLLPTERDVIEKAYNSGATASNLSTQGKDYFTQTFKSYE